MRAFLWRALYAVICVVMLFWLLPLFLAVVGFPLAGPAWTLIRAIVACLAVAYVVFGPPPRTPW